MSEGPFSFYEEFFSLFVISKPRHSQGLFKNYIDMPDELQSKYQYYTQADISKLREKGYDKAFTELEDGVEDYVQNYMKQEDLYK